MAEESIESLVTPEKVGLDFMNISKNSSGNPSRRSSLACHRRASIGSYHARDHSLRDSAEKPDSANSGQNVVPHYLRASTGSCHDLCKYGRGHSFEKKERKPFRKRITKPLADESNSVQILVSDGQKKDKFVSDGPSRSLDWKPPPPDAKFDSPKHKIFLDKAMKKNDRRLSIDTKTCSPKPKTSLDNSKATKQKLSEITKNCTSNMPSTHPKSYLGKPRIPSNAKTYSAKDNASLGNKILLPKRKPSSAKKFPSVDPPEIVKSVIFPSVEVENSVKQVTPIDKNVSKAERKTTYVSQQHPSPVKLKPVKVKPVSYSDNSDGIHGKGIRNSTPKIGKILTSFKVPAKKVLTAPAATMSPKLSMKKIVRTNSAKAGNLKLVSPLKDRNRIQRVKTDKSLSNDDKVSEKTLHVIGMEIENNVSESIPGDDVIMSLPSSSSTKSSSSANSSSLSSHEEDNTEIECNDGDEIISDNNDFQESVEVPPVSQNHYKTLRKGRMIISEDKYRSPVKLKFRSGKVVDLQSDNNSPRRLKFRRGRVLGAEDTKGGLRRRTLKKAGVNDDISAEVSSEKVVLKHQDVQGKKDAQGLFNNVIEETASKLVESRKSKVKALVGAFETVISLQETKQS